MLYYTPGVSHRSPLPLQSYLPEDLPMQGDPMVQLSADLSAVTINEPGANRNLHAIRKLRSQSPQPETVEASPGKPSSNC